MKVFVPSLIATGTGFLLFGVGIVLWQLQQVSLVMHIDGRLSNRLQRELYMRCNQFSDAHFKKICQDHAIISVVNAFQDHRRQYVNIVAKNAQFVAQTEEKVLLSDGSIAPVADIDDQIAAQLIPVTVAPTIFKDKHAAQIFAWLYQLSDELLNDFFLRVVDVYRVELHPKNGQHFCLMILPCQEFDESLITVCRRLFALTDERDRRKKQYLFDLRFEGQIVQTVVA